MEEKGKIGRQKIYVNGMRTNHICPHNPENLWYNDRGKSKLKFKEGVYHEAHVKF